MQNLNNNADVFTTSQFAINNQNNMMDHTTISGVSYGCVTTQNIGSEFWMD